MKIISNERYKLLKACEVSIIELQNENKETHDKLSKQKSYTNKIFDQLRKRGQEVATLKDKLLQKNVDLNCIAKKLAVAKRFGRTMSATEIIGSSLSDSFKETVRYQEQIIENAQ